MREPVENAAGERKAARFEAKAVKLGEKLKEKTLTRSDTTMMNPIPTTIRM